MAINYPQKYDDDFINTIKKLIDHVNEYGKTIQDLVADGQLTEEQYSNLITTVNGMLKSGEVDKSDLTPELRSEVDKVRNKIDKGDVSVYDINKNKGKFDQTYLTQDLIDAITGAPGANILSDVAPRVITNEKVANGAINHRTLEGVSVGKNKFNYKTAIQGYRPHGTTGELVEHAEYYASDYIPISPGETVTISHVFFRAFYDENREYVTGGGATEPATFTMPDGAEEVRFAVHESVLETFQVELGSVETDFEPYKIIIEDLESGITSVTPAEMDEGSNDTVNKTNWLTLDTSTRSTEVERENDRVKRIYEKSGDAIIKTTELFYSLNDNVVRIEETADGTKSISYIQRTDGEVTGILKGVE